MKSLYRAAASLLAVTALPGCAVHADGYGYGSGYPGYERSQGLPSGHLPPPGECRIWYPDRPEGQQPPPGDCDELPYQVPPGARLIHG